MDELSQEGQTEIENREPKMDDVGTRYQHLLDYKESLDTCVSILRETGHGGPRTLAKFLIAAEVLESTLDGFAGYKEASSEFRLYKLLNTVPKTKEDLIAIGGTPLE